VLLFIKIIGPVTFGPEKTLKKRPTFGLMIRKIVLFTSIHNIKTPRENVNMV
jgi:hypothetical protein